MKSAEQFTWVISNRVILIVSHGRKVSGLDDETDFLVFQSYPDDKTYALLRAVCQVSGNVRNTYQHGMIFQKNCYH